MFRYKFVLSDIILKQREQVVVEPIDPCSAWCLCHAYAVDTVRILAREGSSDRMGGAKGKGLMPQKGHCTSLRIKLIFNSLERE